MHSGGGYDRSAAEQFEPAFVPYIYIGFWNILFLGYSYSSYIVLDIVRNALLMRTDLSYQSGAALVFTAPGSQQMIKALGLTAQGRPDIRFDKARQNIRYV